jgi:hypothetical protein
MVAWLEHQFPGLRGTNYRITSPPTDAYNCVAWAVGITNQWWWPLSYHGRSVYWPPVAAQAETLDAVREALGSVGFVPCTDSQQETGFEKVALFADSQGIPTHVARQLPGGLWTSKLGQGDDIEHELNALEGHLYGTVVLVMSRPIPAAPLPTI